MPAEQHIDAVGVADAFWAVAGVTSITIVDAPTMAIPLVNCMPKTAAAEQVPVESACGALRGSRGHSRGRDANFSQIPWYSLPNLF